MAESYSIEDADLLKMGLLFSDATIQFCTSQMKFWKERGIIRVNDLLRQDGSLMNFNELKGRYMMGGIAMDYFTLTYSLTSRVKKSLGKGMLPNPVIHPIISFALSRKQGTRHIYELLL